MMSLDEMMESPLYARFSSEAKSFFRRMQSHVETPLLFYGSIHRLDYVPHRSDIDVLLYTDNEWSTLAKLSDYLKVPVSEFQKVVWKLRGHVVYGYKVEYTNPVDSIHAEISIYNRSFQRVISPEQIRGLHLPMPVILFLFCLKHLYYTIPVLPKSVYVYLKRFALNVLGGNASNTHFLVL